MLEVNQSNFVIISLVGAVSWYEMKQNIVRIVNNTKLTEPACIFLPPSLGAV